MCAVQAVAQPASSHGEVTARSMKSVDGTAATTDSPVKHDCSPQPAAKEPTAIFVEAGSNADATSITELLIKPRPRSRRKTQTAPIHWTHS